jgi:hypothetical protein
MCSTVKPARVTETSSHLALAAVPALNARHSQKSAYDNMLNYLFDEHLAGSRIATAAQERVTMKTRLIAACMGAIFVGGLVKARPAGSP